MLHTDERTIQVQRELRPELLCVMHPDPKRRALAEAIGTAFLLTAVVGSGIMAEQLSGGNVALALLANAIATGAALVALIVSVGPISGAHLNPVVTLCEASTGRLPKQQVPLYVTAQILGAFVGVAVANAMFDLPVLFASQKVRSGAPLWLGEFVATFGLLMAIMTSARLNPKAVAYVVGGYITAAYFFTSSTSFANPAVTLARTASDTFAGIRPADAPAFVIAQLLGAAAATPLFAWMLRPSDATAPEPDALPAPEPRKPSP